MSEGLREGGSTTILDTNQVRNTILDRHPLKKNQKPETVENEANNFFRQVDRIQKLKQTNPDQYAGEIARAQTQIQTAIDARILTPEQGAYFLARARK